MDTDRAVDIIAERLPLASKLTAEAILDDLRAAESSARDADAMRSVIRRLLDGWVVDSCGKCWRHRERLVRGAMSDAERAVIDNITSGRGRVMADKPHTEHMEDL